MLLREAFRDPDLVRLNDSNIDQVAMYRRWWDFEEPLPVVMACLVQGLGTKAFYDVGANTGFYSVLVGRLAPHVPIRAFEPVDWIADQCRENLTKHRVTATVTEVALSDAAGTATLYFPPDDHGLIETSASLNAEFNPVNMNELEVPTARLDDVVAESGDDVGLLKIDVEGHEHAVLEGGRRTFTNQRPLAVIEVLPAGDINALNQFVTATHYQPLALRQGLHVERRDRLEFVDDGWNWLLVPQERAVDVATALDQGAREFHSARRLGRWRHRLAFGRL